MYTEFTKATLLIPEQAFGFIDFSLPVFCFLLISALVFIISFFKLNCYGSVFFFLLIEVEYSNSNLRPPPFFAPNISI